MPGHDGGPSVRQPELDDRVDELEQLGQRIIDAVVAAYDPEGTSGLALALHPGQALADDVVQGGTTNPLRVSAWLADQYDYPMRLKLADGTPVPSTALGGVTATSAYVTMARWCRPGIAADAPAHPRIEQLIADARQDIGTDPDLLPLGCEPSDFAEPTCTAWRVFDTTITGHAPQTSTDVPPRAIPPSRATVNPKLWRLRAVPDDTLQVLAQRQLTLRQSRAASREISVLPRDIAVQRLIALPRGRDLTRLRAARFTAAHPIRSRFDATAAARLGHLQLADLDAQPTTKPITGRDRTLHLHLEYLVVTITRRLAGIRWWHPELLDESSWFVPGMARGALIPPSDDSAYAWCLPVSLLMVRDVSLTGNWSQEARAIMSTNIHYLGPFLMMPTREPHNVQQTMVLGAGVQVIGELCAPLPTLPPMPDPDLA